MARLALFQNKKFEIIQVNDDEEILLPEYCAESGSFLGWNTDEKANYGFMNYKAETDATLYPVVTEGPAYILKSYFKSVPLDEKDNRCQFRRYAIDVYLENSAAESGEFKLKNCNNILYYFGNIAGENIAAEVSADTDERGGPYNGVAYFTTDSITVKWKSVAPLDRAETRKKILTILLCFSKWGMSFDEIERLNSDEIIIPDVDFASTAGGYRALVSANFYSGVIMEEAPFYNNPALVTVADDKELMNFEFGKLLSRFAVLSDSHVGERYGFKDYEWLYGVFKNLEKIHNATPLDFVLQLGDNIDDGYLRTYKKDYDTYLKVFEGLTLCDNENPVENRAYGKIPHYEMQGNHDTSPDTRFFKNKLWYAENGNGEKVAFIGFFAKYGGYPAVKDLGESYKSFGIITDDIVQFVEESALMAEKAGARHIVLCSHFGIAQDLVAPILAETGLSKIKNICHKHNIRLYLNGHEHNKDYTLREFGGICDYDAAMTRDGYAVFEIYGSFAKVKIYNTSDNSVRRIDVINMNGAAENKG